MHRTVHAMEISSSAEVPLWDVSISEDSRAPALSALATSPPGFLPGSVEDADDAAVGTPDPPSAESVQNVSMRGTEQPEDIRLSAALEGPFTLRGELMHCFVSYRVVTEGDAAPELFRDLLPC